MSPGVETSSSFESREASVAHLEDDFHFPEGVRAPNTLDEHYSKLGESGRDAVLRAGIEQALNDLESRIASKNLSTSNQLLSVFHG